LRGEIGSINIRLGLSLSYSQITWGFSERQVLQLYLYHTERVIFSLITKKYFHDSAVVVNPSDHVHNKFVRMWRIFCTDGCLGNLKFSASSTTDGFPWTEFQCLTNSVDSFSSYWMSTYPLSMQDILCILKPFHPTLKELSSRCCLSSKFRSLRFLHFNHEFNFLVPQHKQLSAAER